MLLRVMFPERYPSYGTRSGRPLSPYGIPDTVIIPVPLNDDALPLFGRCDLANTVVWR